VTSPRRPPPGLDNRLRAWAEAHYGEGAAVVDLVVLPGHAGLTYGFSVLDSDGAHVERLVLRVPPEGVRREGNTDVLRQVPVIEALDEAGVPVAPVRFASEDERWFGVPYLMIAWKSGRTVGIDEGGEPPASAHFHAAVRTLGALHDVSWEQRLSDWSASRSYRDEIYAWDRALEKSGDSAWRAAADRVRHMLVGSVPPSPVIGILHGDYQFSNLLFDGADLVAVLDWEISGIGPQLLDLGWFLVINDQQSWAHRVALAARPPDEELRRVYEVAAGRTVDDGEVDFAKALAAYRFAVIAGLNLWLHRSGRRVDDHWELIGPSIPVLLNRALEDLRSSR
jgi:aminoglycoside phosphotransferase (APT) family kinase protein